MKTLYLIRGCSGSGKSTFAEVLFNNLEDCSWVETDKLLYDSDGNYIWTLESLCWAHKETYSILESEFLKGKTNIVLSNTATKPKLFKEYLDMASKYNYRVISLVVENRHGNVSKHHIDEKTLEVQRQRVLGSLKLTADK